MIYESKEKAEKALEKLMSAIEALEEVYGAEIECEGNGSRISYILEYRNEDGDVCKCSEVFLI